MATNKNKIQMFATNNDTDKWAVAIDGYFGLFETEKEANDIYDFAVPKGQIIDDTAFGSIEIIPPLYWLKNEPWGGGEPDKISSHRPINIKDYIIKKTARSIIRCSHNPDTRTIKERFKEDKMWKEFLKYVPEGW